MFFKSFVETLLYLGKNKVHSIQEDSLSEMYHEIVTWTELLNNNPALLTQVLPCNYIFNYIKSEMVYFSPAILNLIGIENSAFLGSKGIIKLMDLINPNDFKVYNEQIFPKDMAYLSSLPYNETRHVTFSNNLRLKQNNGLYKTILIKKCFITDEVNRLPLYEFGILIDISSFKKELSITHTIERFYNAGENASFLKVVTEDYFPEMHANILSAREKEILTHLSTGSKRKEVGVKLFISDNTVANHIKTILRKTNSHNIREAIAICKMNGII
jgi:DNA-binding CsgD family transcriptional regulator